MVPSSTRRYSRPFDAAVLPVAAGAVRLEHRLRLLRESGLRLVGGAEGCRQPEKDDGRE
jgi:hypothetical protein